MTVLHYKTDSAQKILDYDTPTSCFNSYWSFTTFQTQFPLCFHSYCSFIMLQTQCPSRRVTMRFCFNLIQPRYRSHLSVWSAWMDPLMQYGCVDTSSAWIVQKKSRMQPGLEDYATFARRELTPTLIVSCREDTRFKTNLPMDRGHETQYN